MGENFQPVDQENGRVRQRFHLRAPPPASLSSSTMAPVNDGRMTQKGVYSEDDDDETLGAQRTVEAVAAFEM